jgi:heat shock protein HtpX
MMIHPNLRLFFILSWLLIGQPSPDPTVILFIVTALIVIMALRGSFRYHTIVFLGIFGVMLLDTFQFVFIGLLGEILKSHPIREVWNFFSTMFTLNFGLSIAGLVAAVCAAAYIELARSQMTLTKIFPELTFLDASDRVTDMVKRLASSASIEPPRVSLLDSGTPSAFTVQSRRKYIIAVSVGLIESLNEEEVEACLAHEISHLKNRDFAWRFIATVTKMALFTKPLSYVIEPAIYRAREFLADQTAAILIGGPGALISALHKLGELQRFGVPTSSNGISTCSLNGGAGLFKMLDKHPDIESRIRALERMCPP